MNDEIPTIELKLNFQNVDNRLYFFLSLFLYLLISLIITTLVYIFIHIFEKIKKALQNHHEYIQL
jgi:hypothetical protein